jgi:hypothetical protein
MPTDKSIKELVAMGGAALKPSAYWLKSSSPNTGTFRLTQGAEDELENRYA